MARTEPANINQCVAPSITSRASSLTKDQLQRSDEIKNELNAREGIYKTSVLIDHVSKHGNSNCLNEPVKLSVLTRLQNLSNPNSAVNSRRSSTGNTHSTTNHEHAIDSATSNGNDFHPINGNLIVTDILAFNIGRELIVYEFTEPTQSNIGEPIDHRIYKQNHQPTCHDISQHGNVLHVLVGFSKGQIQYINMQTKEQKVFNEGSYLDKSKVTCVKWLKNPNTYFVASYASGYLYVFDEQLNYQRDTNIQPTYSVIRDEEKNFAISYTKNKSKQSRNPVSRWSIGSGSINEFAFSSDQTLLAIVSQDGFLRVFNYEKMELVAYMKSYFGGLLCVCWSPDGKYLATGGEDDFITLFSLDPDDHTPRVVCRGHGHTSWISSISFDPHMNAKTYYSSWIQTSSSSLSSLPNEQESDRTQKSIPWSRSDSTCFDTNLPTLFYRIASVGQDNRLCFWDITEDILKCNPNSKINSSSSPTIVSNSNGYVSTSSDAANHSSTSPSKSSFSSLTSRLSFVRHSNKIHKTIDETSDTNLLSLSNGSSKKSRKVSLLSNSSKSSSSKANTTSSEDSNQGSLSTLSNQQNHASSRRTNFDLTKTTFGTPLCPKLDEIQVIEPVMSEFISNERLNGIYFGENYFLTSSQDGIIAVWEKPPKLLTNKNSTDERTTLINSNSHHSTVSQRL